MNGYLCEFLKLDASGDKNEGRNRLLQLSIDINMNTSASRIPSRFRDEVIKRYKTNSEMKTSARRKGTEVVIS